MPTFLFDKIIFGPVKSRRLGHSLGINLLPTNSKYCNFDCVYCECGWSDNSKVKSTDLPTQEQIVEMLSAKLAEMKQLNKPLDAITFAGNGEPTMHPHFPQIIEAVKLVRDKYYPQVEIAVLSNATLINKPAVFDALNSIKQNILKLDSAIDATYQIINKPIHQQTVSEIINNLTKFNGNLIIQTLFFKGEYNGLKIDNTTPEEIEAWVSALLKIKPKLVMVYTLERDTPADNLEAVSIDTLKAIGKQVEANGLKVFITH